jgi:hypothetical protein
MQCELDAFSFTELIDMIKSIQYLKQKSNKDKTNGGTGLIAIDKLEEHVDDALQELIRRIHRHWSIDRIQANLRRVEHMPEILANFFNIGPSELTKFIFQNPPMIGARTSDSCDEIYFIHGDKRFVMSKAGEIEIESIYQ